MNNLQKKIRSRKLILGVVTGLAAVSVASVGFSSWILGENSITSEAQNVTVQIGQVTDNRMTITIVESLSELALSFDDDGYMEGEVVKGETSGVSHEDLEFTIGVKVTSQEATTSVRSILNGFALTFAENPSLSTLITYNIIQSPVNPGATGLTWMTGYNSGTAISGESATNHTGTEIKPYSWVQVDGTTGEALTADPTTGTNEAYFKATFKFAWGSAFAYANPTRMSQTTFDGGGSDALTRLAEFHADGIQISATLTAYAASSGGTTGS